MKNKFYTELFAAYPQLTCIENDLLLAHKLIMDAYGKKKKILVCGNGGSAADAEHIVGELLKGFMHPRKISESQKNEFAKYFPNDAEYFAKNLQQSLPAISLVSQCSIATAIINDIGGELVFAQQLLGLGSEGDILIGISTSGNAKNVINAAKVAKIKGMKIIGLTGESGGLLKEVCDVTIKAPSKVVYKIQELHLPIYHAICLAVEHEIFN